MHLPLPDTTGPSHCLTQLAPPMATQDAGLEAKQAEEYKQQQQQIEEVHTQRIVDCLVFYTFSSLDQW